MTELSATPCHVCGGELSLFAGFSDLIQVASDCRPWRANGKMAVCRDCGTVQKPVDRDWRESCDAIYSSYAIYHQGAGSEQLVFNRGGAAMPRSARIVQTLRQKRQLPEQGRLLDVGCGNGAFLAAFGAAMPGWRMIGVELTDTNRATVEKLPGVERLHVGDVDGVTGAFDMVVMIHSLEHIPDPRAMLRRLGKKLAPGGHLLIEVPNCPDNPFDLLVADHCTHFSDRSLRAVVQNSGFAVELLSADWVPKELSLLARIGEGGGAELAGGEFAERQIDWLHRLRDAAMDQPGSVGIFGTSIAGSWMAAQLGGKAGFFLDEDPSRIGKDYLGLPVISPLATLPADAAVMLPFPPAIAEAIARRLPAIRFVHP